MTSTPDSLKLSLAKTVNMKREATITSFCETMRKHKEFIAAKCMQAACDGHQHLLIKKYDNNGEAYVFSTILAHVNTMYDEPVHMSQFQLEQILSETFEVDVELLTRRDFGKKKEYTWAIRLSWKRWWWQRICGM